MAVPVFRFPIFIVIRIIEILVAVTVLTWTIRYRGGLALFSDNKDLIFNIHPVLMVISLVLLNGEAMLAYKTVPGTKRLKKLVHLALQFLVFILSIIGAWAALKFHNDKGIDNFYSLHSWLGLACLFSFNIQVGDSLFPKYFWLLPDKYVNSKSMMYNLSMHYLLWQETKVLWHNALPFLGGIWAAGFTTFWYPGGSRNSRATLLPWHLFLGVYIYALAVATCTTGILEKATFLQSNHVISHYSAEAILVNSLGVSIVVLGGFVVLAVISPVNGEGDILKVTAD
ncbi:hypothetical protein LguiA_017375 [Lonicera macranthoides]